MPFSGALPPNIHCAGDYEDLARQALDPAVFAHMAGGAGRDVAVRNNRAAFEALKITPRVLRDVTAGSTRLNLQGQERDHPIWLGPVAFLGLFHPGAERESAAAAAAAGAGFVASTLSSLTLEDIAAAAGSDRWFQLYVQPSREATLRLVRRAEAAGYGAIVVTVDAPIHAPGLTSLRAGFRGDLPAANLAGQTPAPTAGPGQSRVFQGLMQAAPTWADIEWLRSQTSAPLWLKGVIHPDDARAAVAAGVDGLIVSNHGGRELDSAPSSLSALARVRTAVGGDYPVLFDGGIRSGEDIFKAVALGADGVLLGRLQVCALAVAGALGVGHMVKLLREELEVCMALVGCATLRDIRLAEVRPETWTGQEDPC